MAQIKKSTKSTKTIKRVKKSGKIPVVSPEKTKKADKNQESGLNVTVYGVDGAQSSKMNLPAEVFGEKVNKVLIAQAIRVYLANQRQGGASTKTRGQVQGSTRKIFKQKGTGRARHGNIRAPIFVGGGIVFGPVTHDFSMSLPVKMKRKALASALSNQFQSGNIRFIDGLEALKKTKLMSQAFVANQMTGRILLVLSKESEDVSRSARNIEGVDILPGSSLNTYAVMAHPKIVFMKDAVSTIKEIITKEA